MSPVIDGRQILAGGSMLICANRYVRTHANLPRSQQAHGADCGRACRRCKRGRFRFSFFQQPRHQSVRNDRRVAEHRCRIVLQFPSDMILNTPLFPNTYAAVYFRISILRVEAINVSMPQAVQMVEHSFDALVREQSYRWQTLGREIAIQNHDFVRLKRIEQTRTES